MKFFIPYATIKEEEQQVLAAIVNLAKQNTGWVIKDKYIFRFSYVHNGQSHEAEVGQVSTFNKEPVIAILESDPCFLVCTPNRGVMGGEPIYVGKSEAVAVTVIYFD